MSASWKKNNNFKLLENGENFYPLVFKEIELARKEILLETFILRNDAIGKELHARLIDAAYRGVLVEITVDGFGSGSLDEQFIKSITDVGGIFHIYDPSRSWLGLKFNFFRRMHRKLIVIDKTVSFVGGINFGEDYKSDFGRDSKHDYAVEVKGPIVNDIHQFMKFSTVYSKKKKHNLWWRKRRTWKNALKDVIGVRDGLAALVIRDNGAHSKDIERHYRIAFRAAKHELILANAYFFPGYRFLRDLRKAAKRGVKVRLILQGQPDILIAKLAARILYDYLLRSGVEIYEYYKRPFHGKVGLADEDWVTIGSSNLDPISLGLNLEANLMIKDTALNSHLREKLETLIRNDCRVISYKTGSWYRIIGGLISAFVFHCLRRFPAWLNWIPKKNGVLKSTFGPKHKRAHSNEK